MKIPGMPLVWSIDWAYNCLRHKLISLQFPYLTIYICINLIKGFPAIFAMYSYKVWLCSLVNFTAKCKPRHGPLTRYVTLRVAHAPGMPGTFSLTADSKGKPLVSDPGMHHGTCVTHVPWCMSVSLAPDGGENVPGIPGACAPAIFSIW